MAAPGVRCLLMGDDAAPTELAGVAEAQTESAYAWALDCDDYELSTRRITPRRITDAALAVCLVLIAAAGAVSLFVIRGAWDAESLPTPAATPPTTSAPTMTAHAPPPGPWITPTKPVTVTVQAPAKTIQAPPPAGITVEQVAAYDRQFIANLQSRGWTIWDPLNITQQGHRVCAMLQQGATPQWATQQLIGSVTATEAQSFVTTAMLTYPNCP